MRTFEVGKRYGESAVVFEITKRTAKTVTYAAIHHAGRYNENRSSRCQSVSTMSLVQIQPAALLGKQL